jgi:ribosomal protein S27AE
VSIQEHTGGVEMSLSGLFRDKDECPRCGTKFSGIGTVTTKEGWFSVKRTNNYTCRKCGHKWEEEQE